MTRTLIVIPAYNESARLPRLLEDIGRSAVDAAVSFLIVDDGSTPEEHARIKEAVESLSRETRPRLMRLPRNRGKGGAVHAGFELGIAENFDLVGFMDSDGSIPLTELERALSYFEDSGGPELAAVVGSRIKMLGRQVERSPVRHYVGRIFATFVAELFDIAAYDTQCGLKIFRADRLKKYLDVPTDRRWIWDTQLLVAMLQGGEDIHEVPIHWRETPGSKVSLVKDPLRMAWGLWNFKLLRESSNGS